MNYLLICSDTYRLSGSREAALKVAERRLQKGMWPLYPRTFHAKQVSEKDKFYIYIAGHKEKVYHIVAEFTASAVRGYRSNEWFESDDFFVDIPNRVIDIESFRVFEKPINLKSHVERLELTNFKSKNWGACMQGGCKRLSKKDSEILGLNKAK